MTTERGEVSQFLRDHLRLALVRGVGPRTRQALLDHFGSPGRVLAASKWELANVTGIGATLADRIHNARVEIDVDHELQVCATGDVKLVTDRDLHYPRLLQEIHDPPGVLFVRGQFLPEDAVSIAIVGTRHASRYGHKQAARLASGLAQAGFTIVSGLARGIDAAAHRGALQAGGRTIAVLGSGVLNIYPTEHAMLASEIVEQGAVVSELPPEMPPMSGAFPQRNRIVTGMSLGVIVIEAAARSGALISASHAMDQGREVFAVPGRVDQRVSRGCHQLIRDGATLVEDVEDVLDQLGPLVEAAPRADGKSVRHPAELQLNDQEQLVLYAIDEDGASIDDLVVASGLPVHRVLSTISVLEMRHLVQRISGQRVARS